MDDIASSTRISPLYFRAIEAEDFAQLPGGIYAVSYIRQYAAARVADCQIGLAEVHHGTLAFGCSQRKGSTGGNGVY